MSTFQSIPAQNDHFISVNDAKSMIDLYHAERDNIVKSEFSGQNILPISETFNRNALDVLLSKENCAGVRIYYGMDESLKVHAIMVAVTENNEDILPITTGFSDDPDDFVVEVGQRCPDICPPPSPLYP